MRLVHTLELGLALRSTAAGVAKPNMMIAGVSLVYRRNTAAARTRWGMSQMEHVGLRGGSWMYVRSEMGR